MARYSITGENNFGKWRVVRPNKKVADSYAEGKRKQGNKNVRVTKLRS